MESNFVDYVKIYCRSGKGGKGSMHLRHVKYNPNGGPDGGDGGKGGSIILRGNHNYWTLLHLKYERHIFAEHGGNGGRDKCHGTDGKDVYIDVPCGTVVYNAETGKYVCDVTYDGQEVMLLKGGRGGLGNFQFRTATNQAPRYAQPGEPMQEMTIILELKLLADVGLVGFPNAGKSTLVSSLSNARPKIANYPFTTMEPSLGIVGYRDNKSFVMADIPGIIEGAAEGVGLGLDFLRHIERTRVICHVIDMAGSELRDPYEDYLLINKELGEFNTKLLDKPQIIVANKMDLPGADEKLKEFKEKVKDVEIFEVSAATNKGLQVVVDKLADMLDSIPVNPLYDDSQIESHVLYKFKKEEPFTITRDDDGTWVISGDEVERIFKMTKFSSEEAEYRFAKKLTRMGIDDKLKELGAEEGDEVRILDFYFMYKD